MYTHVLRAAVCMLLFGLCAALQAQAQSAEPVAAGMPAVDHVGVEDPNLVTQTALPFATAQARAAQLRSRAYTAHPYTLARVTLLAPSAVSVQRRADIGDAIALLSRSEGAMPPDWLGELTPFFEARAAVQSATRLEGEGYSFRVDPLKLRCSFKIRLGGSLSSLMPLFGGGKAAGAGSE